MNELASIFKPLSAVAEPLFRPLIVFPSLIISISVTFKVICASLLEKVVKLKKNNINRLVINLFFINFIK